MIPKNAAESPCVREHNRHVLGGQAQGSHLQKLQGSNVDCRFMDLWSTGVDLVVLGEEGADCAGLGGVAGWTTGGEDNWQPSHSWVGWHGAKHSLINLINQSY